MIPFADSFIVDLLWQTSYLVDPVAATDTLAIDRQPERRCSFRVDVSGGTTGSGDVVISGTLDGVADSETLTFTGNASKRATILLDTITGITTSGLSGEATPPTISVEAVDETGRPMAQQTTVATDRPAAWGKGDRDWMVRRAGSMEEDRPVLLISYEDVFTPRVGDEVKQRNATDTWRVEHVRSWPGPFNPQQWRLRVSRVKS